MSSDACLTTRDRSRRCRGNANDFRMIELQAKPSLFSLTYVDTEMSSSTLSLSHLSTPLTILCVPFLTSHFMSSTSPLAHFSHHQRSPLRLQASHFSPSHTLLNHQRPIACLPCEHLVAALGTRRGFPQKHLPLRAWARPSRRSRRQPLHRGQPPR